MTFVPKKFNSIFWLKMFRTPELQHNIFLNIVHNASMILKQIIQSPSFRYSVAYEEAREIIMPLYQQIKKTFSMEDGQSALTKTEQEVLQVKTSP